MHLAPPDGARFQASAGDCHCAVTLPLRVSDARGRACESATSGVAFFAPGCCDAPEPVVSPRRSDVVAEHTLMYVLPCFSLLPT